MHAYYLVKNVVFLEERGKRQEARSKMQEERGKRKENRK
jgi:uncharacterized protein YjbJ (UPF0337 family)